MAKKSAHGEPFATYLGNYGLLAVFPDGVTLRRTPLSNGWKEYRRKKATVPLDQWRSQKEQRIAELRAREPWRFAAKTIPSMRTLEEWTNDCMCETPTGDIVEPDGTGPDGAPSWLLHFGMI